MASYEYLTQKQIEILLKCYYLKKYSKVAKVENITADKVLRIKENALQIIQLAYSKSYLQGMRFDGESVLMHMADLCGMERTNLSSIFDKFIEDGLTSESRKYWARIKKTGNVPTAAELLDFIYDKFEVDIEGWI